MSRIEKYLNEGTFSDVDVEIENLLEGISDGVKSCKTARRKGEYRELKGFLSVIESDIKDVKVLLKKGGVK